MYFSRLGFPGGDYEMKIYMQKCYSLLLLESTMLGKEWIEQDWAEEDVGQWCITAKVLANPWVLVFPHWLVTECRLHQWRSMTAWGVSLQLKSINENMAGLRWYTSDSSLDFMLMWPCLHLICSKVALMQNYLTFCISKPNIPLVC